MIGPSTCGVEKARFPSLAIGTLVGATEHISDTAHGVDEARCGGVILEGRSQPVDVDIDGPGLARVVVSPHVLKELVPGECLARMPEEERQQLERLGLDREGHAVAQEAVAGDIDLDPAEIDDRRPARIGRRNLLGPPEEGPDTGRQLPEAERLRHIVVGAKLQSQHAVHLDIPIKRGGQVVGAIGVSGSSGKDDHAVAEAGVAAAKP